MSAVIIKDMEMPKSCDVCPFMKTNDDLMNIDYRYMYCDFPNIGVFVTEYFVTRHPDCPLHPAPEWISVAERLPENDTRVLTVQSDGVVRLNMVNHGQFPEIINRDHKFVQTTHWMPLPESPVDEKETDQCRK